MLNKTQCDWLKFRSRAPMAVLADSVCSLFHDPSLPFEQTRVVHTGRGQRGFDDLYEIDHMGKRVGSIATGGDAMRGWSQIEIPSSGLSHISGDSAATLSQFVEDHHGQYKRVDIALTIGDGSVSHASVLAAYKAGGFIAGRSKPDLVAINPDDPRGGRTIYIGKRDQPKFFRAYEKGFEMLQRWSKSMATVTHWEGSRLEDVYRCELELKPACLDTAPLPPDILVNSDAWFTGSYPFLSTLLQATPQALRLTPQRMANLDLEETLANCRIQYGGALRTALRVYEGDISAVFAKILGDQESKSLRAAGSAFATRSEVL